MERVTIMGGGVFGLSIAFEVARRGVAVQVIERERIGAGSSGGLVGALSPHTPDGWSAVKEFQLDSLLMAGAFWAAVAAQSGIDPGYARTGRLQPLADAEAVARAEERAQAAMANWRGQAKWSVVPGEDGWRGESPIGRWIFDTLSARLNPRQALAALAESTRAMGGEVIERAKISPTWTMKGPTVWATGAAGLADLSSALGRVVGGGLKGQAALFSCRAAHQPQLFADGLHIVPHGDGTVAVGSTSERQWLDGQVTDGQLDLLIARARAASPALRDATVIDRWAGIRPRAASRSPLLGPWPGRPGHFVANGGFKIGFGLAPKVAEVMADLVLEGRDHIPDGFRIKNGP